MQVLDRCTISDLHPGDWERMKKKNNWNEVEMRDTRYNQVLHMVTAAKGAEAFYTTAHETRYEDLDMARRLDDLASQVGSQLSEFVLHLVAQLI